MIYHQRSLDIVANPADIWAVISRFMHIDEFAPLVESVDALTDGEGGVGSIRRCHFSNGTSLVEEITEWNVEGGYKVRLSELDSMPLHESIAEISIKQVGNGRSTVTWSTGYRVKYGPFGWLLGQTLMKMMMGKILDGNLKGLSDKVRQNLDAA